MHICINTNNVSFRITRFINAVLICDHLKDTDMVMCFVEMYEV